MTIELTIFVIQLHYGLLIQLWELLGRLNATFEGCPKATNQPQPQ